MRNGMWLLRTFPWIALATGGLGCVNGGRGAFEARNAAQADSAIVDATSPHTERYAVVAASAGACLDVPNQELSRSPLEARHVLAVNAVREPFPLKGRRAALLGATVYILASPGLTKEWLGHLIECHIARGAQPSPVADPLVAGSPTVDVVSTGNGFAVSITSRIRTKPNESSTIASCC